MQNPATTKELHTSKLNELHLVILIKFRMIFEKIWESQNYI